MSLDEDNAEHISVLNREMGEVKTGQEFLKIAIGGLYILATAGFSYLGYLIRLQ